MSSHKAILRVEKLKSFGNIGGSLSHTYRTRETPNADTDRADQNEHSHSTADQAMQAFRQKIPAKRRKDAVLGLEYFVGGSPEWFQGKNREQQDAYLRDALNWIEQRHGKENVVAWSIHRDETSPHLVVYVVPLDEQGKLNAKRWTGGTSVLSKMQTEFAQFVGERHGLKRGIEGSKARHQTIKNYYGQIQKPSQHITISPTSAAPKVLKKGILMTEYETDEMVAKRLTSIVRKAYSPAVETAKLVESHQHRADEMTRTAEALSLEKKDAVEQLQSLRKHLAPVLELAILDKNEFVELVMGAQERVKVIKAEREKVAKQEKLKQEKQHRIEDLIRVERKMAGANRTFATHALRAIDKQGGDASKVDWEAVERQTIIDSIGKYGQSAESVVKAILEHSPLRVDQASHVELQTTVNLNAPKLERLHKSERAQRIQRNL